MADGTGALAQAPSRGEVWLADLGPARGHEQAGVRPSVVVSADLFDQASSGLAVIVPMATTMRRIPLHVPVDPPEGGIRQTSYVMCEEVRAISTERLLQRWGRVSRRTLAAVEDRLRILLDL